MTIQAERKTSATRKTVATPRPLMGAYFALDTTHLLEAARSDSQAAARRMRRHRVRSRNAQIKALAAGIKSANRVKSSKGSSKN